MNRHSFLQGLLCLLSGVGMAVAAAPLNWWGLAWVGMIPLWWLARGDTEAADPVLSWSPLSSQKTLVRQKTRHPMASVAAPQCSKVKHSPPTTHDSTAPSISRGLSPLPSPSLGTALFLALLWGLGFYGYTLVWITDLHPLTWLGVPWLASVAIALFCWLFISLWGAALPVLWLGLMRQGRQRFHLSPGKWVFLGTALWAGLEWVWSQGPLAWTNLAFTQSPGNRVILHLGQLGGPFLVSAAIAAVNGYFAEAGIYQLASKHGRNQALALTAIALTICFTGHLLGYGLMRQPLQDALNRAIKIGIIQGNVPTRTKLTTAGIRQAEIGYTQGYRQLAQAGAELVLTPEGALPLIWKASRFAQTDLYQAIQQEAVPILVGAFFQEPDGLARSLLTLDATAQLVSRYDKIKLVPLGEYTPFAGVLGNLINQLSPVQENGKPGGFDQRLDTPLGRAIAAICYDSTFPQVLQRQAQAGGEFILTAANLDPYREMLMQQYEAQEVMRAIETDRWLVRATNTGYSGVIDPRGRVIWRSRPYTYQISIHRIYRRNDKTLYVALGNRMLPLCLGSVATFGIFLATVTKRVVRSP